MAGEKILIVEDDPDIQALLEFNLSKEGYKVVAISNGAEAIKLVRANHFDLVLLDLLLPDVDGLEICRFVKKDKSTSSVPIIMVTAKGEESDIVTGLELGANDYIVKPFSLKVLLARVRSVIRRHTEHQPDSSQPVAIDDLVIHPGRREVLVKGRVIELTFTEFEILHYLTSRPGWVFTRYQLVNAVRGDGYEVTDRSVDVQIVGLRRKLGDYGRYIETIRGVGYRFSDKEVIDRQ